LANAPGSQRTIAYRLSDTVPEPEPATCGTDPSQLAAPADAAPAGGSDSPLHTLAAGLAAPAGSLQQADVGIVADNSYFLAHGANSAADMQSIMNQVDGIYQAELGVTLHVAQTVVFSSADPFGTSTDPSTLLNSFTSYKGTPNSPIYSSDVAHLFTRRDLNGSVIGIAWMSTLCGGSYASGLSQDFTTDNKSLVLLTAHELGHNFGAPHDNQSGSDCASTPFGFIMNPYVSDSLALQFSDCSLAHINPVVSGATCLSAVTSTNATPTATPSATATPTLVVTNSPVPSATRTATRPPATATRTATRPPATATLVPVVAPLAFVVPEYSRTACTVPSRSYFARKRFR